MSDLRRALLSMASALVFTMVAIDAHAALITLTGVVSDRGIDGFPRDGVFDGVFGNPSVTQITTPPLGDPGSEERTAVEFAIAGFTPGTTVIDSVMLLLSPQGGGTNLGLGPGESGEVHGYAGDGAIQTTDMDVSNLIGTIGPTADGQVAVALSAAWFQGLVDASDAYAGLMFKGADGPAAVLFNFAGTFGGIPLADRPTLVVDYHDAGTPPPIPEPGTLGLVAVGGALMAIRRRRRAGRRRSVARE